VVLCDRFGGLGGALDRAGVDDGDGQAGQPFAESLGLIAANVGEVDAGRTTREQRPGLCGHRMPGQDQPRRRGVLGYWLKLRIGLGLVGQSREF